MLNEDLFTSDFAPVFADGAAPLCLHLGQPNEFKGSLSALFPAPLHMGFPAVMSAIFRSLFLGKSLPIPLKRII